MENTAQTTPHTEAAPPNSMDAQVLHSLLNGSAASRHARFQRVVAHIEAALHRPLPVKELADIAHLSPFHFAREFHKTFGKPPHAYVTALRMERAKEMLGVQQITPRQVAQTLGYCTQAHFTDAFRRQVGITPGAYRRNARLAAETPANQAHPGSTSPAA